jgi:hypothetical protein
MKRIKLFKNFKKNIEKGDLITDDDIIKCIKKKGVIYTSIVKEYPGNKPKDPITPVDIDKDGLITVEIDNNEYYVDLDDVEKIEF